MAMYVAVGPAQLWLSVISSRVPFAVSKHVTIDLQGSTKRVFAL